MLAFLTAEIIKLLLCDILFISGGGGGGKRGEVRERGGEGSWIIWIIGNVFVCFFSVDNEKCIYVLYVDFSARL